MKQFFQFLTLCALVAVISAAVHAFNNFIVTRSAPQNTEEYAINNGTLTDTKTGCQYITTNSGHITPRMHADGTQVCLKVF